MTVQSVAELRDRFRAQLEACRLSAAAAAAGLLNTGEPGSHQLDRGDWSGDLTDWAGLAAAFDRTENADDVIAAIRDQQSPGVVGDLEVSAAQGDTLAMLERAYRCRHLTPIRRKIHAGARRRGHGQENGVLARLFVGSVEGLLRLSKERPAYGGELD